MGHSPSCAGQGREPSARSCLYHAHDIWVCQYIFMHIYKHMQTRAIHAYTHTHVPIHTWASLVAQLVKNLPAMQETRVRFPGLGRSPGEGMGCPLQYSWASLVDQLVKNLPAMRETWVQSLVRDLGMIPFPGEGKGYPLQYSGLENSMDCIVYGVAKSGTQLSHFHVP